MQTASRTRKNGAAVILILASCWTALGFPTTNKEPFAFFEAHAALIMLCTLVVVVCGIVIRNENRNEEKDEREARQKLQKKRIEVLGSLRALLKRRDSEYPQFTETDKTNPTGIHDSWKKHFDKIFEYVDQDLKVLEKLEEQEAD